MPDLRREYNTFFPGNNFEREIFPEYFGKIFSRNTPFFYRFTNYRKILEKFM